MKKRTCVNCGKVIRLKEEKYVTLGTHEKLETIEEVYFHNSCLKDYFNNCVKKRLERAKEKAIGLLSPIMERVAGGINI